MIDPIDFSTSFAFHTALAASSPRCQPSAAPGGERPLAEKPAPLLMTPAELAELLNISPRKIRAMKATGALPVTVRIGRLTRFRRADVLAWVTAGCPATARRR
jgi:excisionase family DNA binding protein